MGRSKRKKKRAENAANLAQPEEVFGAGGDASGVEDLSLNSLDMDSAGVDSAPQTVEDGGTGSGDAMAGDNMASILADLDDASSPLIPDQIGDDFDPEKNDAKNKAEQLARAKGKSGMSAAAAKRKAKREKEKANKLAAYKAEARVQEKKKDEKRMRTVAMSQNKTARERILRGQTGTRGRMFNRATAKFQIPDSPINLPGTGGSGTQYN